IPFSTIATKTLKLWATNRMPTSRHPLPSKFSSACNAMSLPIIQLVVAYSANRVIGRDNTLPWRLPSDLAHFKRVTLGHPIIMGRNTWVSLGRPLPGRPNLVISRNPDYQADGASVHPSLDAALSACADLGANKVCIIGGEQVFR